MPRKNRGYKKGGYFKDASLVVIACEGEKREKEYFLKLVGKSQRVKIEILNPEGEDNGKSSPKWVLDRATQFMDRFGLNKHDSLWLVFDVDRWNDNIIRSISNTVNDTTGWYIALSNPCFEVWLLLHYEDLKDDDNRNCKQLKTDLGNTTNSGYSINDIMDLGKLQNAILRAKKRDNNPGYYYPEKMNSKVYQLVEHIIEIR